MTLEESILFYEEQAKKCNNKVNQIILGAERCERDKQEYTQLAEWLKILKKAKSEYDEAWRILTHPTPDVRYPDIDRAKMILDVFRDSLGVLNE
jgi:predicted secreted protein